jgi:hypothetical protein
MKAALVADTKAAHAASASSASGGESTALFSQHLSQTRALLVSAGSYRRSSLDMQNCVALWERDHAVATKRSAAAGLCNVSAAMAPIWHDFVRAHLEDRLLSLEDVAKGADRLHKLLLREKLVEIEERLNRGLLDDAINVLTLAKGLMAEAEHHATVLEKVRVSSQQTASSVLSSLDACLQAFTKCHDSAECLLVRSRGTFASMGAAARDHASARSTSNSGYTNAYDRGLQSIDLCIASWSALSGQFNSLRDSASTFIHRGDRHDVRIDTLITSLRSVFAKLQPRIAALSLEVGRQKGVLLLLFFFLRGPLTLYAVLSLRMWVALCVSRVLRLHPILFLTFDAFLLSWYFRCRPRVGCRCSFCEVAE